MYSYDISFFYKFTRLKRVKRILLHTYLIFRNLYFIISVLSMLYVSQHQEEWKRDRAELKDGLPLAYCINLADPEMAEFGGIQIKGASGGICQIA